MLSTTSMTGDRDRSRSNLIQGDESGNSVVNPAASEDVPLESFDKGGESTFTTEGQGCLAKCLRRIFPCCFIKEVEEDNLTAGRQRPELLFAFKHPIVNCIFVFSGLLSVALLFFSEAFLLESHRMSAIIHANNLIYTSCVLGEWLNAYFEGKDPKSKPKTKMRDTFLSFLSIFPFDAIVLLSYRIYDDENSVNPFAKWITVSRLVYFLRLRTVVKQFTKWEDELAFGEMKMFIIKTVTCLVLMIHISACVCHRIACDPFTEAHFKMKPLIATDDVCGDNSWVYKLLKENNAYSKDSPLLKHGWPVIFEHYLCSAYWATVTIFRLGATDLRANMLSPQEIGFAAVASIFSWMFIIAYIAGSLTSLLVEADTEKQKFITRRHAIERYLDFAIVSRKIRATVNRFYDYLWTRNKGMSNWDLMMQLPPTMKAEIYYNVNKFVLDKLPLLANMEEAFLMNLSIHMKHNFFLKGEVLQTKGQNGDKCFYLINGYLEVMHDDDITVLAEIRSGSVIGELHLLHSYPVSATIRCGTECDMTVLSLSDFRKVLFMYPEYRSVIQKRIIATLNQSKLLLTLCKRQNQYPAAFEKLQEFLLQKELASTLWHRTPSSKSYDHISAILKMNPTDFWENNPRPTGSQDFDGLDLDDMTLERLRRSSITETPQPTTLEEVRANVALAVEADVARAVSLSRDLNIHRPPLLVTAPSEYKRWAMNPTDAKKLAESSKFQSFHVPRYLLESQKDTPYLCWKFLVMCSVVFLVCYYPYRLAFYNHNFDELDWLAHAFEFLNFLDFILDLVQPVVLPKKTLERRKDILSYRCKTFYFYFRIFAFFPIEYIMGPICGWHRGYYLFYVFKLNRLFLYKEGWRFFRNFDANTLLPTEFLLLLRFTIRMFVAVNLLACTFEVILKHAESPAVKIPILDEPEKRFYEYVLYWSTQVFAAAGFGDFPLRDDAEIAVTVIGVVYGSILIIYMYAKLSSTMANREQTRVSFNQMYYGLVKFMKERRFGKALTDRVKKYYSLQWQRHEGLLVPNNKNRTAIWDTPKTLFDSVSYAQANSYISRIPLFMYCSKSLIVDVCAALKQYIVPGREVLLYPNDQSRHLSIIVKGWCQVYRDDNVVGKLGPGSYFGMGGVLYGMNRPFRIESINYCQFFCLEFTSFVQIAKRHPKFMQEYMLLRGDAQLPKGLDMVIPPEEWEVFPVDASEPSVSVEDSTIDSGETLTMTGSLAVSSKSEKIGPHVFIQHKEKKKKMLEKLYHNLIVKAICPYGYFLKSWTLFRIIAAFIIGNFVIIQYSFSVSPLVAFWIVLAFDIISWLDMLISFRVGYYGMENQLITDWRWTALHYISGPFALDLLGCLPIELLFVASDPKIHILGDSVNYNNKYWIISGLRLMRMVQCYRLFITGDLLSKLVFKSLSFLALLETVPLMVLFLNLLTCCSVLFVCGPSISGEPISCDKGAWIINGILYANSSSFHSTTVMHDPVASYIIALYWVMSTAFCVGFGDLTIVNYERNREVAIAVLFLGVLVSGYLVAKLTACLVGEDSKRIIARQKTQVMFRFLDRFGVRKDLKRRLRKFYFGAWEKNKGIFPKHIFSALHPCLQADVFNSMYDEHLRQSPIFEKLDEQGIRTLALKLKETFYPEGEFLMEYGDLSGDVYFVAKGLIACYTDDGEIIAYVGKGSLLGESSCLLEIQRQYTAVAATDCEIYVFPKEDFLDFLALYPEIGDTLEKAFIGPYQEWLKTQAQAEAKQTSEDFLLYSSSDVVHHIINLDQNVSVVGEKVEIPENILDRSSPEKKDAAIDAASVLSLLFGSAREVPFQEAKKDPEFIQDPIGEAEAAGRAQESGHNLWSRLVSYFLTFGTVSRDEMGMVHIIQEHFNPLCFVIHPASPILSHSAFFLFMAALSCGLTAYEIAFQTPVEPGYLFITRMIVEVFFLLRIIGNLHLTYYDKEGGIVILYKKLVQHYLLDPFGFALDMLTTFPFHIFSYFFVERMRKASIAADIRGLKFLRICLFPRYLRYVRTELRMNVSRVKIIQSIILMCLIIHCCACAWYLLACYGMECRTGSWMDFVINELIIRGQIVHGQDVSLGNRYLTSLYYCTTTITFTGLPDIILARTHVELCGTIAMMFVTIFVMGFLVGEMSQSLASQVKTKIHYRHKLTVLLEHFASLGLSSQHFQVVRRYFRVIWLRCNGVSYTSVLNELPYPLRADITMCVYGSVMKNSRLIGKLDEDVIRQLSACIHHEIYIPGSHIVRSGDVCSSMYFIRKGQVKVMDNTGGREISVDVLNENQCFGEVKVFLTNQQFRFSYLARVETEVGVLQSEDIYNIIGRRKDLLEELIEHARNLKAQRRIISGSRILTFEGASASSTRRSGSDPINLP